MIKNKSAKHRLFNHGEINLNNISNMKIKHKDEDSDNVFSDSDIPSFSSDESPKQLLKVKKSKENSKEQTITTQPFTHDKNCNMFGSIDANSLKTSSKNNIRVSEHVKISSLTSKFTLDGVSNQTCSCITRNTKSRMFGADSQYPSTYNDINNLTEDQIQEIIRNKMKLLDKYNETILKKKNSLEYKWGRRFGVTARIKRLQPRHVEAIVKLQQRFRGYLVKKSFFKAIKMNQYIEHKRNFMRLKRCIENFDKKNKSIVSYFGDSVYDFFNA